MHTKILNLINNDQVSLQLFIEERKIQYDANNIIIFLL